MKKVWLNFIVVTLILLIITSFPIVWAEDPVVVQNKTNMQPPYLSGDSDASSRRYATADYNVATGIVYAYSYDDHDSTAWAEANLTDAFEIIHSSQYDITFNFVYTGLIEITDLNFGGEANAKIVFKVSLVDRNGGITIGTKNEEILRNEECYDVLDGSKTIVLNEVPLEEDHIYDWTAGIRTEVTTIEGLPPSPTALVDFYDDGYQVDITQVLVEDVHPDTVLPTTTSSISGTIGENGWYTSSVSMTLIPEDNGYGVDYTNYRINGEAWNIYTSTFTVNPDGTNEVDFYSVDKAGNEEFPPNTETVKIDKIAPTASVLINGGSDYTSATLVPLSLSYSDVTSGVSKVRYRNEEEAYTDWENPSGTRYWTLTSGDGTKTVYYQTKDNAGNISPVASDDIILDTTPPSATISINEGDEYANSTSVTLYLQDLENQGALEVRYRNSGDTFTIWEPFLETKQWILLPGDGVKTVEAQFRDMAGVKSNIFSDSIVLDTIPPTGSIEINNGAPSTTSISVTITPNATDANGVAQMRLRNDGGEWSSWEEVTTKQWNLSSGLGVKTVFVQFTDNTGLISPDLNATIELVSPPPTPSPTPSPTPVPTPTPNPTATTKGHVIVYVKDGNNNPVDGAIVLSNVEPTGQSPLSAISNSQGVVTFNNIAVGTYSFHATKGSFGSYNVQVNVLSQQTISVKIVLKEDLTKPSISITITPENSSSPQRAFSVTAEDDIEGSGIATITLYIDNNTIETWTTSGTHIYAEEVYSNGTHTYYVEAMDNAGNIIRNPLSGYLEFSVEENGNIEQLELWKILGIVLVVANGTALVLLAMKRKK